MTNTEWKKSCQFNIDYVKNSLAENNQNIDGNHRADYLAVTNSNFIMQGDDYSQFLESVNNWYNQNDFCYDDCILLALYEYMDIIDYTED